MTVRSLLVAVLPVLVFGAAAAPASAAELQGDQEIAALNGQRAMNGIPGDIVENVDWSIGCAKHMAWAKLNGLAHVEPVGSPGYTPEGDEAGRGSVLISSGSSFSANGANQFQQAPIHLMQMLSPFLKTSGAADGCLATQRDTDRAFPALTTFSYPGDGGVAPISETAYESPYVPGDFVGLPYPTVTGPHLYFYAAKPGAFSRYYSRGTITAATLTRLGPGGGPVAVETVDNTTVGTSGAVAGEDLGMFLPAGGIVIPRAPLTDGASYEAHVDFSFTPNGPGTVSRTWTFTASTSIPLPVVPPPSRPPLVLPTPIPTPTPTPAPTPAATPTPTPGPGGPAPTPQPGGVDTSPVTITELKLKARSLAFKASRAAPLWVTIERKTVTGKGKKRTTKYSLKDSLSVQAKAGEVVTVSHKKLAKGAYRVTFLRGGAKGARQLTKSISLK